MEIKWNIADEMGQSSDNTESLWINFHTENPIATRSKTYVSSTEAAISPIASKIFGFPWVDEIQVHPNSILIKRQDWVDFDIIAEPLKELITEHFQAYGKDYIDENPEPPKVESTADLSSYSDEEASVVRFLEEEVNPQVASHGGKISFVKLEGDVVHLRMEGGCQGCGMAQVTLREGVEKSLVERFTFVSSVVDITDHSSGIRPYI